MSINIPSHYSAFTKWKEYNHEKKKEEKRKCKRKYYDITPNQEEMYNSIVISDCEYSENDFLNQESKSSITIVG